MGGNALKNCSTRRYDKQEYFNLTRQVYDELYRCFGHSQFDFIKSYVNKESYGDMDILINSADLPAKWAEYVVATFNPKEYVKNGNVLSFDYKEFQIDLIVTHPDEYETSVNYFAYNDLGNLLGRLAQSMGLKLGHDGLSFVWKTDTQQYHKEVISTDWGTICNVLGVSYSRYCEGFDELEDIFKFVTASPFFRKEIYLLENRNNYARTRDKKRKTYQEFLKYIEDYVPTMTQQMAAGFTDKELHLKRVFKKIPGFEVTYHRVHKQWLDDIEYKNRFNGDLVRQWTGLDGKELGAFMQWFKDIPRTYPWRDVVMNEGNNQHTIQYLVMLAFERWRDESA